MILLTFLMGLITSYLGSITPSMLNITAIKLRFEQGKKQAIRYAAGVSFIVVFQAYIGLLILTTLHKYPNILDQIQYVIVVVFAALSIYFFRKSKQEKQERLDSNLQKKNKNTFLIGLTLSSINMFAIPFFCGIGTLLDLYNWLDFDPFSMFIFSFGSSLGTFLILYHYIILAQKIQPRLQQYTHYFNYILGGLTGFLALFTFFKLL